MRLWMALLAVAPACGFKSQGAPDDGKPAIIDAAPTIDGAIDAPIDAAIDAIPPDAQACFGTLPRICFTMLPGAAVQITSNTVIDTGNSPMCNQNHGQADKYCVIAGTSFQIANPAVLRANGSKPLVLISTNAMFDLSGSVDVSSHAGTLIGAGGNSEDCVASTAATMNSGGAGGSFGGKGGDGKSVDGNGGVAASGTTTFPNKLRGGCKGGAGAGGDPNKGDGGNGGGAVEIVGPKVVIGGQVNASGAGGHGGAAKKCGGGGGGAGGMVVIDSPMIMLVGTASVFANGGGGAQGGAMGGGNEGADGGEALGPLVAALGGNKTSVDGGPGAAGAAGPRSKDGSTAGDPAGPMGGGGGGGGASGFIRAPAAGSTMISPTPE